MNLYSWKVLPQKSADRNVENQNVDKPKRPQTKTLKKRVAKCLSLSLVGF